MFSLNGVFSLPAHSRKLSHHSHSDDKDMLVRVLDPKYLYHCVGEACQVIKEYDISADNKFNCHDLAIKVELPQFKSLKTDPSPHAFLTTQRALLDKAPPGSNECVRIRR